MRSQEKDNERKDAMNEDARKSQREYMREYRRKERDLMDEHTKEIQREYMRQWRRQNKEKVKEYNRRYWERRAGKMAAQEMGASK